MSKFSGWLVFAGLLAGPMAQACVALPTELAGLPLVRVIIAPTGGREQVIDAYLAQSPPARAQGFQNVCAEQIQIMAILFVFDSSGLVLPMLVVCLIILFWLGRCQIRKCIVY